MKNEDLKCKINLFGFKKVNRQIRRIERRLLRINKLQNKIHDLYMIIDNDKKVNIEIIVKYEK